jgi:hypothetical protein
MRVLVILVNLVDFPVAFLLLIIIQRYMMNSSTNPFRYVWRTHLNYSGLDFSTVIEVRPRFGQVSRWQIAIPSPALVVAWGIGPSGGVGTLDTDKSMDIYSGPEVINGVPVTWFGARAKLSPWKSAYMGLFGDLPDFVAISAASELLDQPGELEIYSFNAFRERAMVVNA